MKLYIFDSCPYCVRSRMLVGLKDIPCTIEFLMGDDFDAPNRMIGRKAVPILEKDDGSYLGESWEINQFIDELGDESIMNVPAFHSRYQDWYGEFDKEYDLLCYPRMPSLDLPELSTRDAMAYFVSSRERLLGMTLVEALARGDEIVPLVEAKLEELYPGINQAAAGEGSVAFDDLFLFPVLRNLSMVKSLRFPAPVRAYTEGLGNRARIPLYFDRAV